MGSAEGDDIGNQVSVNSAEGGVGSKRLVTVGAGYGRDAMPDRSPSFDRLSRAISRALG
jgi:hypothetical protein